MYPFTSAYRIFMPHITSLLSLQISISILQLKMWCSITIQPISYYYKKNSYKYYVCASLVGCWCYGQRWSWGPPVIYHKSVRSSSPPPHFWKHDHSWCESQRNCSFLCWPQHNLFQQSKDTEMITDKLNPTDQLKFNHSWFHIELQLPVSANVTTLINPLSVLIVGCGW